MAVPSVFSCPYCACALIRGRRDYACAAHHMFPIARSGYVNLCPSARGGDTLTMLTARRRFLEAGHYRSLQQIIATIASRHLRSQASDANQPVVVDVGCREGSHLAGIGGAIKRAIPAVCLVGLDLSKEAARMTARRDRSWEVAVADVRRGLPLREGSAQVLLNVFAPRNAAAFSRVLTSDGIAIIAVPSEDHLVELRDAVGLLRVEPMKLDRLVHQSTGDLALTDVVSVDESHTFDVTAIEDIVMMTPNAGTASSTAMAFVRRPRPDPVRRVEGGGGAKVERFSSEPTFRTMRTVHVRRSWLGGRESIEAAFGSNGEMRI